MSHDRAGNKANNIVIYLCLLVACGTDFLSAPSLSQQSVSQQSLSQQSVAQQVSSPRGGSIHGMVKSGEMPIPGATVVISIAPTASSSSASAASPTGPSSSQTAPAKVTTWTDVDGSYSASIPSFGSYTVKVQMAAFANSVKTITVDASHAAAEANFELILFSRTPPAQRRPAQAENSQTFASRQRGFQSLQALQGMNQDSGANSISDVVPAGMPVPGVDPNSATESIAVSGNTSNPFNSMSGAELEQRINDARQQGGGFGSVLGGAGGGPGGGGFGGGGGRGGGGGMVIGRRGFDINHPHGSIYYGVGDSALNAAPYTLTGEPALNPGYLQNSFGGSIGGPLNIPKIYHGGTKTFFFVNFNGKHGENPFEQFSTVPTPLEREGNFSQTLYPSGPDAGKTVVIYNPATNTPFLDDTIAQINPAAAKLLSYIPLPNLPGSSQNFRFITSATNNSDDLNARINHNFGAAPASRRRGRNSPRNALTFGLHYHQSSSTITNPFPAVGGNSNTRSFDIPISYVRSIGKLTNSLRFDFNRSRTSTQNLYAYNNDIAAASGITGVSQNPFDWGLPNLSFANFASLQDTNPQLLRNQTYTFSDYVVWTHGKNSWRWGGDYRRVELNTETDANARGSFVFTGANTAQVIAGTPQTSTSGYDLADFLLGLPQQTSVQFGYNNYHFAGNYWDLYAQDEWKVRSNVTLNLGVRYEYVSPFTEENNRIANLDLSPAVLNPALGTPSVALVLPGQVGPFSGSLPASLVRPDRNNFAPRIGFAWKPFSKTVVRGGYGINYNTGAYQSIAQQLAFQPPFSTAETNVQTAPGSLTLENGFPPPVANTITNNFAVNPNYRLGYVQVRNLDIQQQIRPTLLLNIDYTGTKGTDLDVLEAPNRTLTGVRISNAQAFTYENSLADSEANAGSIRVRKRLSKGISIGGIYTFSKSIDDASSIGGGTTSGANTPGLGAGGTGAVGGGGGGGGGGSSSTSSGTSNLAQNPFDLPAERGLSSFNQTHRFTADYLWELPFGVDKRWLTSNTPLRAVLGDWQVSGDWTIASGLPFTPRVLNNVCEVAGGTTGTLRPDVTGEPVQLSNPSIGEWFNVNAFAAPAGCQYGNARRNSIIGPGTKAFDMALTKVFSLKESRMLEFRAQATNFLNIPNYSSIDTVVNSPTFGRVTAVGAMRQITFSARFRF